MVTTDLELIFEPDVSVNELESYTKERAVQMGLTHIGQGQDGPFDRDPFKAVVANTVDQFAGNKFVSGIRAVEEDLSVFESDDVKRKHMPRHATQSGCNPQTPAIFREPQ